MYMAKAKVAPKVGTILISVEEIQTWLVKQGDREPANTFNTFAPYYCKFCDMACEPKDQAGHYKAHKKHIAEAHARLLREREVERKRQREAAKKAKKK
jgi:hypothetical protein